TRSREPAYGGFPQTKPRGGKPHPDRDGRTRRRLSRRRIGLRRLFPAQPLCRCEPRGRALTRQALITRGLQTASLIERADPFTATLAPGQTPACRRDRKAIALATCFSLLDGTEAV